MVYIPLNCAIVVEVYKMNRKDNVTIPKTMTELYSSLIRSLLLRYLREHYKEQGWRIRSFSDLPPDVHKQLCELGRIAYKGIANDQQVIFSDLPEDFETLDLMQCVPELYVDEGAVLSYNFLHLTIQEYLAVFYLSQQPVRTQVEYFDTRGSQSDRSAEAVPSSVLRAFGSGNSLSPDTIKRGYVLLRQMFYCSHFQMVLQFLAGLTNFRDYPPNDMTPMFLETNLMYDHERGRKVSTESVSLEALHWIFEAQDNSIFEASVVSPAKFHVVDDLTHFDYFVLGHCISHNNCTWNIQFEKVSVHEGVEMLVQGVLEGATPCKGHISELEFFNSKVSILKHLVCIISSLEVLKLVGCELEDCLQLLPSLPLKSLVLQWSYINTIEEFRTISSLDSTMKNCQALSELLSSSTTLEVLDISNNTLSPEAVEMIFTGLSRTTSLRELDMAVGVHVSSRAQIDGFSPQNVALLVSVLKTNQTLVTLNILGCGIEPNGACALADALRVNTSLQKLNLSQNNIGSGGACALADALCVNTSLQELHLPLNDVGPDGIRALADALCVNTSLQELNLPFGSIGSDGAYALADALHTNTTLQTLCFCFSTIGDRGATALAEAIRRNRSLRTLNLGFGNYSISMESTQNLIDSLTKNSTLQRLVLPGKYKSSLESSETYQKECHRIEFW